MAAPDIAVEVTTELVVVEVSQAAAISVDVVMAGAPGPKGDPGDSGTTSVQSVNTRTGDVVLAKSDVGLAAVDNTPDSSKPISTAQQTALDAKQSTLGFTPENAANKNAASGYAGLGSDGKVPPTLLPAYVDDVLEFINLAAMPAPGTAGVLYVADDTGKVYRWSGSQYIEISASPGSTDAVPEGSVNLYFTAGRAAAAAPVQSVAGKGGAVTLVKADVGLSNVDNTADASKPVSGAQQAALNLKAATTYVDSQDALNEKLASKGAANGYAPLDGTTKIPSAYLPSYVDDVLDFTNLASFPATGEAGKIYIADDTNFEYRWNIGTSAYIRIVASPGSTDALAEGTTNLYYTDARVAANATVATKANDAAVVHNTGTENIAGQKTFTAALTTFIGNALIEDAAVPTKAYRFRTSGSALDLEGAGADLYLSMWTGASFTGTQYTAMVASASGGPTSFPLGISASGATANVGGLLTGTAKPTSNYTVAASVTTVLADATTAGFTVTLGNAFNLNGRLVLVKRIDSAVANTLTLASSGGPLEGSTAIAPGGWKLYMGNSSGTWQLVGDSTAASLGAVGLRLNPSTRTAAFTLTASSPYLNTCGQTANYAATLPSAIANAGLVFKLMKTDNSAFTVTVTPVLSQTINGAATYALGSQFKYVEIMSDGANWLIVDGN